jgi:hypothetical protein
LGRRGDERVFQRFAQRGRHWRHEQRGRQLDEWREVDEQQLVGWAHVERWRSDWWNRGGDHGNWQRWLDRNCRRSKRRDHSGHRRSE